MTIMNAKEYIKLEPMTIKRDVGMYILATLSIITFGFMGELSVVSASVMLAEYALLVLIVYI